MTIIAIYNLGLCPLCRETLKIDIAHRRRGDCKCEDLVIERYILRKMQERHNPRGPVFEMPMCGKTKAIKFNLKDVDSL